jgi:Fe-S-cluster containining protein
MFIHIKPEETRALKAIPKALLFPAPGLPSGNMLMGYNQQGECPMLVEGKCAIYDDRPQTCRDYDCRVFAATGIALDEPTRALISEQVKRWKFEFPGEIDRKEHSAVQAAARFLIDRADAFPQGALPGSPTHFAILAIRIHDVFATLMEEEARTGRAVPDADVVKAVLSAIEQQKLGRRR